MDLGKSVALPTHSRGHSPGLAICLYLYIFIARFLETGPIFVFPQYDVTVVGETAILLSLFAAASISKCGWVGFTVVIYHRNLD